MEMNITGVNAGVIRNNDEFLAVALKLNIKKSDTKLRFLSGFDFTRSFLSPWNIISLSKKNWTVLNGMISSQRKLR